MNDDDYNHFLFDLEEETKKKSLNLIWRMRPRRWLWSKIAVTKIITTKKLMMMFKRKSLKWRMRLQRKFKLRMFWLVLVTCYKCSYDVKYRSNLRYHKGYIHETIRFFYECKPRTTSDLRWMFSQMITMLMVLTITDLKAKTCSGWDNKPE